LKQAGERLAKQIVSTAITGFFSEQKKSANFLKRYQSALLRASMAV
jgi:hypothetical protein